MSEAIRTTTTLPSAPTIPDEDAYVASTLLAPPVPHPDADLIAACAAHLRLHRAFGVYVRSLPNGITDDDPARVLLETTPALTEQIVASRPVTPEGQVARLKCAAFHYRLAHPACADRPDAPAEERFVAAALRDFAYAEWGDAS